MRRGAHVGLLATALAAGVPAAQAGVESTAGFSVSPTAAPDPVRMRAEAMEAIGRARAKVQAPVKGKPTPAAAVLREVTLPSIERLVEDADLRLGSITDRVRDQAFVRRSYETARLYAEHVVAGEDPYRTATGMMVKAYRADWDDTLQPYALYVPASYKPGTKVPLIVALHGAWSDHRHNLRRVFGLDNRPGETDAEASRNELPLPDVPAIVVSPFGRGELMGYDGLGGDDVMRVIADVRRAYDVDPDRITLTGLSMGGGGAWAIGLRHPELFAALAPVCGVAEFTRMVPEAERALYDLPALQRLSPAALADRAARMQVFIFHGALDPTVPVTDSRHMVDRFKALGYLGKNVHYTEYPTVDHFAWKPAYEGAALLRTLAAQKRDPAAPRPPPAPPAGQAIPGLFGKSLPRQAPHLYVYGTRGPADAVAAAKALAVALADWGPMVGAKFAVKPDSAVTAADRARFNLVVVGAAPLNALAAELPVSGVKGALGDRAYRAVVADPRRPGRFHLLMGALTAKGFARLQRFAHVNQGHFEPEPNRPLVILQD
jgi:predicted esterase